MTFVRTRARILEISTTSGGGPLALNGAADGSYNTFASFMSVGDQTFVTVIEPGVAFWSGIATYSAANQLTLTTVEETKGTFGVGTKEVMASPLASSSMLREDISGAIVTGGTSTAYTVASFRKYNTLAELAGNIIAFTPHVTNTLGSPQVSLNVDGLGAKSLRADPAHELPPGVLIAGTPYTARYDNVNGLFLLHGVFGLPYSIPLGAGLDYWGSTAPSSAFAFPTGQQVSRTVYADLFALFGTTYGTGDGSTTFNLPDKSGRVSAMVEPAASRLTTAGGGVDGATIGSAGGSQTKTLLTANLPPYTPAGSVTGAIDSNSLKFAMRTTSTTGANDNGVVSMAANGGTALGQVAVSLAAGTISGTVNGTPQGGTSTPVANLPPMIVCNYIIRVL
ncbi:microcystin-dependent protein [Bradyrhizobium ottawaense]|uniref:phage tail protein n=1 Tax=Bradyrhizobium ottawaense TaxID=931866 RepID=UPI003511A0B8